MRYLPGLDGLRALACLAVVAHHANAPGFGGGFIGVDVFFVLSGYLITRVLRESEPTLLDFYARRLWRLTPPLLLMLVGYLAVFPLVFPDYPHGRDALLSMLYLSDFAKAHYALPEYVGHTWSLSIEEHFYLLWPLLLYRFRPGMNALLVAWIAATLWRNQQDDWHVFYYAFSTHCSGLILGCLAASFPRDKFPAWPGLLALAYGCYAMFAHSLTLPAWPWIEWAAFVVVLGKSPAWMESRPLVYLGKLSYGMYLWHYPIAQLCLHYALSWQETLAWSLLGSIALAAASYHTVEAAIRARRSASGRRNQIGAEQGVEG